MTPLQQTLGWIYLFIHVIALPLLIRMYDKAAGGVNPANANLVYYAFGVAFVAAVMLRYLRREFDALMDRLGWCIITALLALLVMYALNTAATLVLMLLEEVLNNPNNDMVAQLAREDFGAIKALSVFIAPIVEEVLFRGVLFGSLRERSRGWAYVVSVAAFGLYHVWQSALAAGDWTMLLYAVQYVPISVVLAWCYERSGSLWTGIFYHMGYNAISFTLLTMMM